MYGRIVKSERILTKLRVLDYEYICDRIAKFHKKILFITRVIKIFKYWRQNISVSNTALYTAVRPGVRKWRCVDAMNANKWRNHVINKHGIFRRRSYFNFKPRQLPDSGEAAGACVPQPDLWRRPAKVAPDRRWEHFHHVVIDEAARPGDPVFTARQHSLLCRALY